jgi:hypothetical protein
MTTPSPENPQRWRWLKREAINLGDVVVQIFAVVVGILLALFINDWVMQRQQQATVAEALRAIHAELAQNQAQMHRHYLHLHDMVIAMRKKAKATDAPRHCTAYGSWRGTGQPLLLSAAYQTAIADQALAQMPFSQAQQIAKIYGYQQIEQKLEDSDASFVIWSGRAIPEADCAGIVDEMADNARELEGGYSQLLKLIAAPAARH